DAAVAAYSDEQRLCHGRESQSTVRCQRSAISRVTLADTGYDTPAVYMRATHHSLPLPPLPYTDLQNMCLTWEISI
ncbi:hypothetical protein J6590_057776, partial [Homalodisca vitripennis]